MHGRPLAWPLHVIAAATLPREIGRGRRPPGAPTLPRTRARTQARLLVDTHVPRPHTHVSDSEQPVGLGNAGVRGAPGGGPQPTQQGRGARSRSGGPWLRVSAPEEPPGGCPLLVILGVACPWGWVRPVPRGGCRGASSRCLCRKGHPPSQMRPPLGQRPGPLRCAWRKRSASTHECP